jgi:hypothetical protein
MPKITAYKDTILCIDGDFGNKTTESGIIVKSTIGSDEGIAPRWFQAFDIGPEIDWIKPGQWLYVAYGRWTEGFSVPDDRLEEGAKIWKVDPDACMMISDTNPTSGVLNIGKVETFKPDMMSTGYIDKESGQLQKNEIQGFSRQNRCINIWTCRCYYLSRCYFCWNKSMVVNC